MNSHAAIALAAVADELSDELQQCGRVFSGRGFRELLGKGHTYGRDCSEAMKRRVSSSYSCCKRCARAMTSSSADTFWSGGAGGSVAGSRKSRPLSQK
ncbi:MAG: hypothetical protein IRZ33_10605 [Alicyclobacillaceae bacterium]|nr:hypothetical protein [Alicyclobacillaceae bacterium]